MMLRTAVPMLAGVIAMSGYSVVDTYFVGQLPGETPLAAMGFTFPIIMLIMCFFSGIGVGVMSKNAHALGANRRARAARLVSGGLLFALIFSVCVAVLGLLFGRPMYSFSGASGESLELVEQYMGIWFWGCATGTLSQVGNSILLSLGDIKTASFLMVAGMLLNVVLDPIFIFGFGPVPPYGIAGAAIATVICQGLAAAAILYVIAKRHKLLRFEKIPVNILLNIWKQIAAVAIPATLGSLMIPAGSFITTKITASWGDSAVAAVAAAGRLEVLAFAFPMALGWSLTSMVAQNYGAGLYDRIRSCHSFSSRFAFAYLLFAAAMFFIFSDYIASWFSTDEEVRRLMSLSMKIIPWGFGMLEIQRYSNFFYIGCNRPGVAAWLNAWRIVGLLIPLSLAAMWIHYLPGLFVARLAADVISGTTGYLLVYRMVRRLNKS